MVPILAQLSAKVSKLEAALIRILTIITESKVALFKIAHIKTTPQNNPWLIDLIHNNRSNRLSPCTIKPAIKLGKAARKSHGKYLRSRRIPSLLMREENKDADKFNIIRTAVINKPRHQAEPVTSSALLFWVPE